MSCFFGPRPLKAPSSGRPGFHWWSRAGSSVLNFTHLPRNHSLTMWASEWLHRRRRTAIFSNNYFNRSEKPLLLDTITNTLLTAAYTLHEATQRWRIPRFRSLLLRQLGARKVRSRSLNEKFEKRWRVSPVASRRYIYLLLLLVSCYVFPAYRFLFFHH